MTSAALTNPYSELVKRYFANPVHAGQLPDEYNKAVVGEAAESETGARVILYAVVDRDTVRILRYQVFGCPHLIAAAEAFCGAAEGQPVATLLQLDVPGLMDKLTIPVEKTGRVLILEDAAKALHIELTGTIHTQD
ncbi:MAG: iron-sulfur cluster assembly scaffold protein [Woeseiaceae bacterium]